MDQYSEELGAHQQYGEQTHPDTLHTVDVDSRLCKVLDAQIDSFKCKTNRSVAQWICDCGHDQFRVFARNLSTVAKCIECNREKQIHEG